MRKKNAVNGGSGLGQVFRVVFLDKENKKIVSFYRIVSYQSPDRENIADILYQEPTNDQHAFRTFAEYTILRPFSVGVTGHPGLLGGGKNSKNLLTYCNCKVVVLEKLEKINQKLFHDCILPWEVEVDCPKCKIGKIKFKGIVLAYLDGGIRSHCVNCRQVWQWKDFEIEKSNRTKKDFASITAQKPKVKVIPLDNISEEEPDPDQEELMTNLIESEE